MRTTTEDTRSIRVAVACVQSTGQRSSTLPAHGRQVRFDILGTETAMASYCKYWVAGAQKPDCRWAASILGRARHQFWQPRHSLVSSPAGAAERLLRGGRGASGILVPQWFLLGCFFCRLDLPASMLARLARAAVHLISLQSKESFLSKRCGPPGLASGGRIRGRAGQARRTGSKACCPFSLPMRTVTLLRLPSCPLTYRSSALRLVDRHPAKQEL